MNKSAVTIEDLMNKQICGPCLRPHLGDMLGEEIQHVDLVHVDQPKIEPRVTLRSARPPRPRPGRRQHEPETSLSLSKKLKYERTGSF